MAMMLIMAGGLQAQATLSFQGILKKANGIAVDDGTYSITFKLYDAETGGNLLWTGVQSDVEVTSGIYSVILTPTGLTFNAPYFLGISVGAGSEMIPRFRLTSAPYALSLIGDSNLFPSAGQVKADRIAAKSGFAASGGYSFQGPGDTDGGLFSTQDDRVSINTNNAERMRLSSYGAEIYNNLSVGLGMLIGGNSDINGNLTIGTPAAPKDLNLQKGGSVVYNGVKDWQLVETDDFSVNEEGWSVIAPATLARTQLTSLGVPTALGQGWILSPSVNGVIQKQFDFGGISHKQVKIKFTVYYYGSDCWDTEWVVGGFFTGAYSNTTRIAKFGEPWQCGLDGVSPAIGSRNGEMTLDNYTGNTISVYFNSFVNEGGERYGVGNVEVYVR
jgi:hypothetical protein